MTRSDVMPGWLDIGLSGESSRFEIRLLLYDVDSFLSQNLSTRGKGGRRSTAFRERVHIEPNALFVLPR